MSAAARSDSGTPAQSQRRLVRPEASLRSHHVRAGLTVAAILSILLLSFTASEPWGTAIAMLAAGAGAGYSLSGSV